MAAEMFPLTGAVTFRDAEGLEHKQLWEAAKQDLRSALLNLFFLSVSFLQMIP